TDTEFSNLLNNSSYTRDGGWSASDYGYVTVTLNNDSSKKLEFPAVGGSNTLQQNYYSGKSCEYWSSSTSLEDSNKASYIWFNSSLQSLGSQNKACALSVRCVKGSVKDSQVDPFETVTIGGVEWMPLNLADAKQSSGGATFATKLPSQCFGSREQSFGKVYRYGVNVAWDQNGLLEGTASIPWSTTPCPDGYRLPTYEEFYSLINNSTVTRHGGWSGSHDSGWIEFTSGSKSLEFPAAGYKSSMNDGMFYSKGTDGVYWSATTGKYYYALSFTKSGLSVESGEYGSSIRCVKGDKVPDIDPFKTVNIGGIEWMQLNLANPRQASGGATFAKKRPNECTSGVRLESHGKFYQWGVNVAWNTTGASASGATPSGTWQTSTSYPSDWNISPCPNGYRLPTGDEFRTLISYTVTSEDRFNNGNWSESDYGYVVFTSKADPSQQLYFTAVGFRDGANGSLISPGKKVMYWAANGIYLNMSYNSTNVSSPSGSINKRTGMSVRCVRQ
ncbi:MAG: hypothetical protein K2F53_02425, partial [Rikenellaceae bacterium]|nr:hypothetical protein [Rikenellaceae bacterium]